MVGNKLFRLHRWVHFHWLVCDLWAALSQVSPEELTLVHNLRKLVQNDWVRHLSTTRTLVWILFLCST